MTGKKFTLAGTYALASNASVNNCIGNITVQGFRVANTEGQTANMTYVHDLILQYNEFTRTATGSLGPTVYVGPGNNGPCNASINNTGGPDNVTVAYNYIHAGWGEGIYVGASTGDPFTNPCPSCQQDEYTADRNTCALNCNTGQNYLIAYNTVESTASWGGQGDGTDVKDGHANLILRGNTYRTSLTCIGCGSATPGSDGQGIVAESASIIEDNYIETPCHNGIAILASWFNEDGRSTLTIRNNIIVNINSTNNNTDAGNISCGGTSQSAINLGQGVGLTCSASPVQWNSSAMTCWTSISVYNNSVSTAAVNCVKTDNNDVVTSNATTVENNICQSTGGIGTSLSVHEYNDCYLGTAGCNGAHDITSNPNFVSTTAGSDANFKVQPGSPVLLSGLNLSSSFTNDYRGNARPGGATAWTIGAWQPANGTNSQSFTQQPTNVVIGTGFSPTITVTVSPAAADSVTLSVSTGTCTLSGTLTVTANAGTGVATFSGVGGTATGSNCVLTAHNNTDGTVADITSSAFNVTNLTSQTITFGALSGQTLGAAPFTVSATASSNLTVTFSSKTLSVCTVSGTTVTLVSTGTCTIAADQAGNSTYASAPEVTQSFLVSGTSLISQTITFGSLGSRTFGGTPFTVSATASSNLTVSFSSKTAGVCTVSGATVTIVAAGTCTIAADQGGNSTYAAAPEVTQSFAVAQANQTITFSALSGKTVGAAPFTISASSTSTLAVTFSSTTPVVCTVSGTTVTIIAVGTCTIAANQAGNSNYNAATQVTQSFSVSAASQTITFAAISGQGVGVAVSLNASATSGLAVTFSSMTASVCTVSGTTANTIAVGTCTIAANQAGNSNYNAAPQVTQSFAAQTLNYYVDANYLGGTRTGSSSQPWHSMQDSGAWSAVNTSLASGPVTVYFSACLPTGCTRSSSGDQLDTNELLLNRTDTSTNLLTLDGMTEYNASTNTTSPNWMATGNPACNAAYDARTHSQHRITTAYPINSDNAGTTTTRGYITIQGFRVDATVGQIVYMGATSNSILQCNELYSTAAGKGPGPGVIVQTPQFHNPLNASNLTIQYNKIHDTYGEGIYIGSSSPDPPNFGNGTYSTANGLSTTNSTTPSATGLTVNITAVGGYLDLNNPPTVANGGTGGCYQLWDTIYISQAGTHNNAQVHVGSVASCRVTSLTYTSNMQTSVNTLIQNNEIYDTATQGGQGDGTDIKDGNVNLILRNNTYYRTTSGQAANCNGCRAIVAESWAVMDSNFIHDWTGSGVVSAVAFPDGWINTYGRSNGQFSNNILINVGGGRDAIEVDCGAGSTTYQLKSPSFLNNTIYNSTGNGWSIDSSATCRGAGQGNGYAAYPSNITLENNITSTAASGSDELVCNNSGSAACSWNTHSHNSWFRSGSNFVIRDNGTSYGPSTLSSWESSSQNTDPQFTSTSTPYSAPNFTLRMTSPDIAAGLNLSAKFTNDFCSNTRQTSPTVWDIGAWIDNPTIATGCVSSGVAPTITVRPQSQTISSGAMATLSVTATGDTPSTYQWYRGTAPGTGNPVGNNAPATFSFSLSGDAGVSVSESGSASTTVMQEYHALIQQSGVSAYAATDQANSPGSLVLGGVAIFGYRQNGILVTEAGVRASPPITSGRVYTEISSILNTGIALSNLTSIDATINFYFTDNTGNDIDAGSMTLKSDHQTVAFLNQPPFNGPTGTTAFQGTFTFTSNVPIGAIALRMFVNERGDALYTTVPVAQVGVSPNANVLPHFADGAGWTTSVFLTNASNSIEAGTIQFFGPGSGSENAPLLNITLNGSSGMTFNYSIPAHSSARFDTADLGRSLQVGSIVVTPVSTDGQFVANDVPSAVSLIQLRQGGITISNTTFVAAPTGSNFQLYMEASGINGQAGSVQSALAVANPSANPVTAHIDLYYMDGTSTKLPTATINLPPGGEVWEFLDQFFPTMPASFQGIAKLTTSAPVAVAAVRGHYNERGDFLMTTTPPVNDAYTSGNLVFPLIVNGQGFSSQIIVFGENPGSGELYLFSSGGVLQANGSVQ